MAENNLIMPPVVLLPSGIRQPWGQIVDYRPSGSDIVINRIAGSAITFTPNNQDAVLAQLDKVPTMAMSPVIIVDDAITFVSVTPASVSKAGGNQPVQIIGTGLTSVVYARLGGTSYIYGATGDATTSNWTFVPDGFEAEQTYSLELLDVSFNVLLTATNAFIVTA